ncbi:hypothetical protein A1704_15260 [Chryseobacterium cucumeris]|uniref:hypothetical protein n=1 Tax=Chryseobacterium cucumeris TaxID=1813611 RepID=UPI0007882D47|nr:hypothetical protein [Chryseobacterium cucumeris]KYH04724.1 hypothetical protein A1704_15260 [Chryseobacterium cucumeris]
MENYDNHNLQPKRKRKTKDERLAEIQEKKKKLLAEEARLKQSAINERRKKRLNTFYTFGGTLFTENWETLSKILIDEKNWSKITVYIDDRLFAEKSNKQDA